MREAKMTAKAMAVTAITLAVALAAWELLSLLLHAPTLPGPWAVFGEMAAGDQEGLLLHLLASTRRVLASLAISLVTAVPLGLYLGRNPGVDAWGAPFLYLTYPIPKIVLLPIVLTLLGLSDASRIFLVTLTVFYQILVTTRDAVRALPAAAIYSVQSLGARERQIYRHVLFPFALPKIFTALRISVGTAIAVLFFAESFATNSGLGYLIMDAWGRADYELMFAAVAALSLLGLALYLVIQLLERSLCKWQR
ncbi:MAG: ABC transporter permease [Firmicutes bacterium]|nr:ABC transporter permease [Bacillota bacterium]